MDSVDRLLTVEDLADYLDVPVATVYAMAFTAAKVRPVSASGGIYASGGATSNAGSKTASPKRVTPELHNRHQELAVG